MVPPPNDRREELLSIARSLLSTIPLSALSLADVAREANVSWGTVRRHLGSREELLALLGDAHAGHAEPDTRRRLLDAAVRTFARLGYDRASMDEIASEAGLTKGALYWHFASKIELFKAIMAEQRAREIREMPDAPRIFREAATPEEAWETMILALIEDLGQHSDWVWLIFEFLTSSRDEEIRQLMLTGSSDINNRLISQFEELKTMGKLPEDVSPEFLTAYWAMLVNGLGVIFLVRPEIGERAKPLAKALAQLFYRGLQP